jgi:hypothetical protein
MHIWKMILYNIFNNFVHEIDSQCRTLQLQHHVGAQEVWNIPDFGISH